MDEMVKNRKSPGYESMCRVYLGEANRHVGNPRVLVPLVTLSGGTGRPYLEGTSGCAQALHLVGLLQLEHSSQQTRAPWSKVQSTSTTLDPSRADVLPL